MGCLYDIYIEFLASIVHLICKISALFYNKNTLKYLEIYKLILMEFYILDFRVVPELREASSRSQ